MLIHKTFKTKKSGTFRKFRTLILFSIDSWQSAYAEGVQEN